MLLTEHLERAIRNILFQDIFICVKSGILHARVIKDKFSMNSFDVGLVFH